MKTLLFALCLALSIGLVTFAESRAIQLETPSRAALPDALNAARK